MLNPQFVRFLRLLVAACLLVSAVSLRAAEGAAVLERSAADRLFAEGSYALAEEAYGGLLSRGDLTGAEEDFLWFRQVESGLRGRAALRNRWAALPEQDARALEVLGEIVERVRAREGRRPGWAGLRASQGLLVLDLRRDSERARAMLGEALEVYGSSTDLDHAREAYLKLVFALAVEPPYGLRVSERFREVGSRSWLQNAVRIAVTPEDQVQANLLLGDHRQRVGADDPSRLRAGEAFRNAVAAASGTDLEPVALLALGEWSARYGYGRYTRMGRLVLEPDFGEAVDAYERLLTLTAGGPEPEKEALYGDDARHPIRLGDLEIDPLILRLRAQEALTEIRRPRLEVLVGHTFKPDAQVQFAISWRNIEELEITVWPTSVEALLEMDDEEGPDFAKLPFLGGAPVWQQSIARKPARPYLGQVERVRLPDSLPIGAYRVEARSGEFHAVDLLLISEAAIVLHGTAETLLVQAVNSFTGDPLAAPKFTLRAWGASTDRQALSTLYGREDGNALFDSLKGNSRISLLAETAAGPAFVSTGHFSGETFSGEGIWAFPVFDRPIYRPGETVHWRVVFVERESSGFRRPAIDSQTVTYRITKPNEGVIKKGDVEVSSFGTAHGSFELPPEGGVGTYMMTFELGEAQLLAGHFEVAAYRVPEFEVTVTYDGVDPDVEVPVFELGETVIGRVVVRYFAGGPVGDAEVDVRIFRHSRIIWAGLEQDPSRRRDFRSTEFERIDVLSARTDSRGEMSFQIPTSLDEGEDFEYLYELSVRDFSQREITVGKRFFVTRQPYRASLKTENSILRPADRARVLVKTEDPNGRGLPVEGRLRVVRERWRQVYIHQRRGNEISGDEFRALPERALLGTAQSDYRLKEEGFVTELISEVELATNESGEASFSVQAPEVGYYRVTWMSAGRRGVPITAETIFWVATAGDSKIGYRPGGVELHFDTRTYVAGEKVPVLVTTDAPGRTVLLVRGEERIRDWQVLRLTGNAHLVLLDTSEADIPNLGLRVSMVFGDELFIDHREIEVTRPARFIDIDITFDRSGYKPGDPARAHLQVRDEEGLPVEAELSIGVADEAVYSLMPEAPATIEEALVPIDRSTVLRSVSSFTWRPVFRPRLEETPEEDLAEVTSAGEEAGSYVLSERAVGMEEGLYSPGYSSGGARRIAPLPPLRTDFRSTVAWFPSVVTDAEGRAAVEWTFPDNTTKWRTTVVAVGRKDRWGQQTQPVVTELPLIIRLLPPRFLIVGDASSIGVLLTNNSGQSRDVQVALKIDGGVALQGSPSVEFSIAAGETKRVSWDVLAEEAGSVQLTATALGGDVGDGVSLSLPVYVYGAERLVTAAGRIETGSTTVYLDLPENRKEGMTDTRVIVSPSIATALLDALPYLIEFPYGSVEQTVNRFFPAVVVSQTLQALGFPPASVQAGLFGEVDSEHLPEAGAGMSALEGAIAEGLARLEEMQLPKGAWPWMPRGEPDEHMTAYVLWALEAARHAGVEVNPEMLARARAWLGDRLLRQEASPQSQAWILHALSSRYSVARAGRPSTREASVFLDLIRARGNLSPNSQALLALTAVRLGFEEDALLLLRNLRNSMRLNEDLGAGALGIRDTGNTRTAHWGRASEWWNWWQSPTETTAFVLQAMLAVDPTNEWIVPTMNWLVRNRTATRWQNTRDTAVVVTALTDYLRLSGELESDLDLEVRVNDGRVGAVRVRLHEILECQRVFEIPESYLREGENRIELRRRSGDGPIYYTIESRSYVDSPPIGPAGGEIMVGREYLRVGEIPTLLQGFRDRLEPLSPEDSVQPGDRVEVVLTLEAKTDLRYLVIEDAKAGGMEPLQGLSGERLSVIRLDSGGAEAGSRLPPRQSLKAYQELHDRNVVFFIDHLPEGVWELRYRLRAESPGHFHALPAVGRALYVPRIRGNSASSEIEISNKEK